MPERTPRSGRTTPRTLLNDWRRRALDAAIASLLFEVGCSRLTVDDVARRTGVAKGSLRLGRGEVEEAIERVLDRWAEGLPPPSGNESASPVIEVCRALFATVTANGQRRVAFPCCLQESPCPYGWADRWPRIAAAYGLGTSELSVLVGEAVQAVASSPEVRGLLAEGNGEAALDVLLRLIDRPT